MNGRTVLAPVAEHAAGDEQAIESVAAIVARAGWSARLTLSDEKSERMSRGRARLTELAARQQVYGLTRGFGPLAEHSADPDPLRQGGGLIDHLTVGQGTPLPAKETRVMVWLRLHGMTHGHSAVDPMVWQALADQWNRGFTPVVPQDGSLSASGDLVPLAHAAQAAAGSGEAWERVGTTWRQRPAAVLLAELGLAPVRWDARTALAFVNGTSAALARTLVNHRRLAALARAAAALTGRLACLLGSAPEPFGEELAAVRGHHGHAIAAALIRREFPDRPVVDAGRPFQEPYCLRCAPQVIGAVLDQVRLQESVLVTEATGCTDNPVLVGGRLHHGGNFHAAPVALVAEQQAVCVHQLAYLLERQLALAVHPDRNGGLPPLLARCPGGNSGLAGVQIAATSHLAAIRQRAYPASCTPVPTNLDNQDHVPMALNAANAVAEMLDRAWWIAASACHALVQIHRLTRRAPEAALWTRLSERIPELVVDRPLATETAVVAAWLDSHFSDGETLSDADETRQVP